MQELNWSMQLEAANGKTVLASLVFAHALRYFKDCCLRELNEQTISSLAISPEHIQWVITVPAIWRQSAKQFMRHAATQVSNLHSIKSVNENDIEIEREIKCYITLPW